VSGNASAGDFRHKVPAVATGAAIDTLPQPPVVQIDGLKKSIGELLAVQNSFAEIADSGIVASLNNGISSIKASLDALVACTKLERIDFNGRMRDLWLRVDELDRSIGGGAAA
jgi:hypothetical protein